MSQYDIVHCYRWLTPTTSQSQTTKPWRSSDTRSAVFCTSASKRLAKLGLEPQHHQLMLAVKGAGEQTEPRIAYLAERLQLEHHSVVELVDRLAKRGLIQRTRSQKDRREVHVKLTPRGERILKQLTLDHGMELRTAASALIPTLKKVMTITRSNGPRGKACQQREWRGAVRGETR